MVSTPSSNRLHIGIFGKCNSGKSSVFNAITGQYAAIVSEISGTTTDPVMKAMEISGAGPCLFIDTAGFDDNGILSKERIEKTERIKEKTDIALIICADMQIEEELKLACYFQQRGTSVILVINKNENVKDEAQLYHIISKKTHQTPVTIHAKNGTGIELVLDRIIKNRSQIEERTITGNLVKKGDNILLVMPQDRQAPEGRLILPQAQTIRELLDKQCITTFCTPQLLEQTLNGLVNPPHLIITDSQVVEEVSRVKPPQSKLTTFSVLFAYLKGDIKTFITGAKTIDKLMPESRVLIAEACTHAPLNEDIGRKKIPNLLQRKLGGELRIDIVSGNDFPDDLTPYDLIIHCGACMFNRHYLLSRIEQAKAQQVPMTNYGTAISHIRGILDNIVYPSL